MASNLKSRSGIILCAVLSLLILGCGGSGNPVTPDPDPDPNSGSFFPKKIVGGANEIDNIEYDDKGRIVKVSGTIAGSYFFYRYETNRVVKGYYIGSSKTSIDQEEYILNEKSQRTELRTINSTTSSSSKNREYNFTYDADGHLLNSESEMTNSSGVITEKTRSERIWKDGNLIRWRRYDLLKGNALTTDRTYEYDLTKTNTLLPQAMPHRFPFGSNDPNFNLRLDCGKGNKNVVTKDISTADPTKFGSYSYKFDGQGRISEITYFGDKIQISY